MLDGFCNKTTSITKKDALKKQNYIVDKYSSETFLR